MRGAKRHGPSPKALPPSPPTPLAPMNAPTLPPPHPAPVKARSGLLREPKAAHGPVHVGSFRRLPQIAHTQASQTKGYIPGFNFDRNRCDIWGFIDTSIGNNSSIPCAACKNLTSVGRFQTETNITNIQLATRPITSVIRRCTLLENVLLRVLCRGTHFFPSRI